MVFQRHARPQIDDGNVPLAKVAIHGRGTKSLWGEVLRCRSRRLYHSPVGCTYSHVVDVEILVRGRVTKHQLPKLPDGSLALNAHNGLQVTHAAPVTFKPHGLV